jgi:hypothetical protein
LKGDTLGVTAIDASLAIACSLRGDAARGRESQWHELLARAAVRHARAPGRVRIELRALPGVRRELERLVAAERDCCSFMTMSVETTDDQVLVLAVTAPASAAAILKRLFEDDCG